MRNTLLVGLCLSLLVGCAPTREAIYRPPRPDELRPGDIPPSPGPFVESVLPPGVQVPFQPTPTARPYLLPTQPFRAAPVYQVPVYQMPIQKQTVCNTQMIGNQLQTVCY